MTPYPYELEQLARETGVSPLETLELFLERAAIREYDGGFDRDEAERLALGDVRETCSNKPHDRIGSTEPHSIGSGGEPRGDSSSGSQGPGEPITNGDGSHEHG